MSMKYFYNPNTGKIMGASDTEASMEAYPFVESEQVYHSFANLGVELKNGVPALKVANGTLEESIYTEPTGEIKKPYVFKIPKNKLKKT